MRLGLGLGLGAFIGCATPNTTLHNRNTTSPRIRHRCGWTTRPRDPAAAEVPEGVEPLPDKAQLGLLPPSSPIAIGSKYAGLEVSLRNGPVGWYVQLGGNVSLELQQQAPLPDVKALKVVETPTATPILTSTLTRTLALITLTLTTLTRTTLTHTTLTRTTLTLPTTTLPTLTLHHPHPHHPHHPCPLHTHPLHPHPSPLTPTPTLSTLTYSSLQPTDLPNIESPSPPSPTPPPGGGDTGGAREAWP